MLVGWCVTRRAFLRWTIGPTDFALAITLSAFVSDIAWSGGGGPNEGGDAGVGSAAAEDDGAAGGWLFAFGGGGVGVAGFAGGVVEAGSGWNGMVGTEGSTRAACGACMPGLRCGNGGGAAAIILARAEARCSYSRAFAETKEGRRGIVVTNKKVVSDNQQVVAERTSRKHGRCTPQD